jgi:hypothetical protein
LTDIFSLGLSFKVVLISQKIQVDPKISELISEMSDPNIDNRPLTNEIIFRLIKYCALREYEFDIFDALCKDEKFCQPFINPNFENILKAISSFSVDSDSENYSIKLKPKKGIPFSSSSLKSNWRKSVNTPELLRSNTFISGNNCVNCNILIKLFERKNSSKCK